MLSPTAALELTRLSSLGAVSLPWQWIGASLEQDSFYSFPEKQSQERWGAWALQSLLLFTGFLILDKLIYSFEL